MNEETKNESQGRVPRPEEVLEQQEELAPEQRLRPLRCQVGSRGDDQCPRDATTRSYPGSDVVPAMCEEHARAQDLSMEAHEWGVAEEITGDWLRISRAWHFEDLEQLAVGAHESAIEGVLKAEARAELAGEIADAPRKGRKERIRELTPEQDERLRRLMRRSDELNNAYTALQGRATGAIPDKNLRRTLAVLAEERDHANEETRQLQEELGLRGE